MPANAQAQHATVFKNGTATFMARVLGTTGVAIVQADVSTLVYSIWLIDENVPDTDTVVTGHDAASITVSAAVYDALQASDARWDADKLGGGYNFLYTVTITTAAFTVRGRRYRVRFTFTPASGQKYHVEFVVGVV